MKVSWDKVFGIIMRNLDSLILLAEGLFFWKSKAGAEKKAFVENGLKTVVDAVAEESTGGQADFWSEIGGSVSSLIDATVDIANKAGAFEGSKGGDLPVSPVDPS